MAILCLSVPAASPESKGLRCGPGAILPEPDSPREAMATVSRKVSGGTDLPLPLVAQVGKSAQGEAWQGGTTAGRWRAPSCNVKAVLFMLKRAQAGELLVSRWSELRETALVLIILKGSFGTPVTLVIRAERAIFPLPGGREREFISERKIYKQIFNIYIFNFLLKNTFRYCLAF